MHTIIIDPVTPKPYSLETLRREPLGGTEATVIRVAEALDALVVQHNRKLDDGRYRSVVGGNNPKTIIVLRDSSAALKFAQIYPHARTILWLHDLAGPRTDRGKRLQVHGADLVHHNVTIVCVSNFHASDVRSNFASIPESRRPKIVRIYNPVDVSAVSVNRPAYDRNKLVFFSSPHKGLDYALSVFSHLHRRNPELRLFIANPGYRPNTITRANGVINLGAIPHSEILEHVGSALCTFYPNYIYPETFGLAFAESNALGTPVLTHNIGAAAEVLNGVGQFIDVPKVRGIADSVFWRWPAMRRIGEATLNLAGASSQYQKMITDWQLGQRPVTEGRPEFLIRNVKAAWLKLT